MTELFAYTDGACSGNPGPGGWGALLIARDGDTVLKERELNGGEAETTNNRMELLAAISALEALGSASTITVVTDSAYVKNGVESWIHGWKRNGPKTSAKKPVKTVDLWQRLDEAQSRHEVTWEWVKGHAGHPENERADELARAGMEPFKPKKTFNAKVNDKGARKWRRKAHRKPPSKTSNARRDASTTRKKRSGLWSKEYAVR